MSNASPYSADLRRGIRCIACGEPIWGTLEEAAREKGFGDQEIQEFVRELNELLLEGRTIRTGLI